LHASGHRGIDQNMIDIILTNGKLEILDVKNNRLVTTPSFKL